MNRLHNTFGDFNVPCGSVDGEWFVILICSILVTVNQDEGDQI